LKEHIFSYAKNIDQVCYNNLLFRDKTFKINNLSQLLKVPESHLIYLFKYHSSLSFSEYRTQCRINDAITLISKNYLEKNTLESLAIEVGFSSYNPFYTSFKISTKFSPTQYILKNGPSISL
jgi:AraC-like DNA-binding protein